MLKDEAILSHEMCFYKMGIMLLASDESLFNSLYQSIYILYTYQEWCECSYGFDIGVQS